MDNILGYCEQFRKTGRRSELLILLVKLTLHSGKELLKKDSVFRER